MQNDHTEALADQDPEYRRLHDEHRNHEERLQVLAAKSRLSEDEEIEEKRLKKEKLLIKDKMEEIARTAGDARAKCRSRSPSGAQECDWLRWAKARPSKPE